MNEHLTNEQFGSSTDTALDVHTPDPDPQHGGTAAQPWPAEPGRELPGPGADGPTSHPDEVDATGANPVDEPVVEQQSLEVLAEAVTCLQQSLSASLRTQENQQELLDRMHAEREELRDAERRRQRDPVLRDLIQLADTCLRNSRQWHTRGDVSQETAERVSSVLLDAAADVRLILERQGVEVVGPVVGDPFSRSESKAIGTLPTADAAQDGLVAEVRKSGYLVGERVLRFSEVVVWRFEPGEVATEVP